MNCILGGIFGVLRFFFSNLEDEMSFLKGLERSLSFRK